jgi:hypothetical protein
MNLKLFASLAQSEKGVGTGLTQEPLPVLVSQFPSCHPANSW